MTTWRGGLHVLTAVAVATGLVVAVVTGSSSDSVARVQPVPVSTSIPTQWAPPAAAVTVPPTTAATTSTTTTTTTTTMPVPTTTAVVLEPPTIPAPVVSAPPSAAPQLVAQVTPRIVQIYDQPGDIQPTKALYSTTWFGSPTTLPVVQRGGDWLKVQLPLRPNGSQGWIHAQDASLAYVVDRVEVDLADRTLVWSHAGKVVLQATVAIGAAGSPTPTGTFFVTDLLPQDPSGPYGAWIIALDAHSDAFTSFEGGDARIAIHGTNDPASLGEATSSGCVRTDAGTLDDLARALPLGTPVEIR